MASSKSRRSSILKSRNSGPAAAQGEEGGSGDLPLPLKHYQLESGEMGRGDNNSTKNLTGLIPRGKRVSFSQMNQVKEFANVTNSSTEDGSSLTRTTDFNQTMCGGDMSVSDVDADDERENQLQLINCTSMSERNMSIVGEGGQTKNRKSGSATTSTLAAGKQPNTTNETMYGGEMSFSESIYANESAGAAAVTGHTFVYDRDMSIVSNSKRQSKQFRKQDETPATSRYLQKTVNQTLHGGEMIIYAFDGANDCASGSAASSRTFVQDLDMSIMQSERQSTQFSKPDYERKSKKDFTRKSLNKTANQTRHGGEMSIYVDEGDEGANEYASVSASVASSRTFVYDQDMSIVQNDSTKRQSKQFKKPEDKRSSTLGSLNKSINPNQTLHGGDISLSKTESVDDHQEVNQNAFPSRTLMVEHDMEMTMNQDIPTNTVSVDHRTENQISNRTSVRDCDMSIVGEDSHTQNRKSYSTASSSTCTTGKRPKTTNQTISGGGMSISESMHAFEGANYSCPTPVAASSRSFVQDMSIVQNESTKRKLEETPSALRSSYKTQNHTLYRGCDMSMSLSESIAVNEDQEAPQQRAILPSHTIVTEQDMDITRNHQRPIIIKTTNDAQVKPLLMEKPNPNFLRDPLGQCKVGKAGDQPNANPKFTFGAFGNLKTPKRNRINPNPTSDVLAFLPQKILARGMDVPPATVTEEVQTSPLLMAAITKKNKTATNEVGLNCTMDKAPNRVITETGTNTSPMIFPVYATTGLKHHVELTSMGTSPITVIACTTDGKSSTTPSVTNKKVSKMSIGTSPMPMPFVKEKSLMFNKSINTSFGIGSVVNLVHLPPPNESVIPATIPPTHNVSSNGQHQIPVADLGKESAGGGILVASSSSSTASHQNSQVGLTNRMEKSSYEYDEDMDIEEDEEDIVLTDSEADTEVDTTTDENKQDEGSILEDADDLEVYDFLEQEVSNLQLNDENQTDGQPKQIVPEERKNAGEVEELEFPETDDDDDLEEEEAENDQIVLVETTKNSSAVEFQLTDDEEDNDDAVIVNITNRCGGMAISNFSKSVVCDTESIFEKTSVEEAHDFGKREASRRTAINISIESTGIVDTSLSRKSNKTMENVNVSELDQYRPASSEPAVYLPTSPLTAPLPVTLLPPSIPEPERHHQANTSASAVSECPARMTPSPPISSSPKRPNLPQPGHHRQQPASEPLMQRRSPTLAPPPPPSVSAAPKPTKASKQKLPASEPAIHGGRAPTLTPPPSVSVAEPAPAAAVIATAAAPVEPKKIVDDPTVSFSQSSMMLSTTSSDVTTRSKPRSPAYQDLKAKMFGFTQDPKYNSTIVGRFEDLLLPLTQDFTNLPENEWSALSRHFNSFFGEHYISMIDSMRRMKQTQLYAVKRYGLTTNLKF